MRFVQAYRWHPRSCWTFKYGPEGFAIPLDANWTRIENMELPEPDYPPPRAVPEIVSIGTDENTVVISEVVA